MLSYTGGRLRFGQIVNDSTAATLTIADALINDATKALLSSSEWYFMEKTKTLSTVSNQQGYDLPSDLGNIVSLTVTNGSFTYTPILITDRREWDVLNTVAVYSDIPQYYFIFGNQVKIYPIPSSSTSNAITYIYHKIFKDLSIADYTTGTITSIANGASAVVGSGTTWTTKMAGRFIRFTDSDTANTGDGYWYEIASIDSTTTLTLDLLYNGTSIAVGTATYAIGQISHIPEEFQILPIYKAAQIYYTSIKPESDRAKLYETLYNDGLVDMTRMYSSRSTSPVITSTDVEMKNPNNFYHL